MEDLPLASPETHPERYVVALGSNLGDRSGFIGEACALMAKTLGPLHVLAPLFETAPVGAADQPFLNTAVLVAATLPPAAALAALLQIEATLGRVRREKWGNRTLDLDLLLWRRADAPLSTPTLAWSTPTLTLPHPQLLERDFALVPASCVAPEWIHPGTGRTIAEECAARGYTLTPLR